MHGMNSRPSPVPFQDAQKQPHIIILQARIRRTFTWPVQHLQLCTSTGLRGRNFGCHRGNVFYKQGVIGYLFARRYCSAGKSKKAMQSSCGALALAILYDLLILLPVPFIFNLIFRDDDNNCVGLFFLVGACTFCRPTPIPNLAIHFPSSAHLGLPHFSEASTLAAPCGGLGPSTNENAKIKTRKKATLACNAVLNAMTLVHVQWDVFLL